MSQEKINYMKTENRPSININPPTSIDVDTTSIDIRSKPNTTVSEEDKFNNEYLTPDEFGVFRDPDGYARAIDGRKLNISRKDIADTLQTANGAENLFVHQRNIPEYQQKDTKEFYDTADGIHKSFKQRSRHPTRPSIDVDVPTSVDRRPEFGRRVIDLYGTSHNNSVKIMSSGAYYRSWMHKPHLDPNTNLLTKEYIQGIGEFMRLVQQQSDAKSGFSRNYKVWYIHGETDYEYGSTSEPQPVCELQPDIRLEESRTDIDYSVDVDIDRQSTSSIDRRAPITYRVQMQKIDVSRLNALRPKPKPSDNPPETVRIPSDDGEDSMDVDRVPMGRTLRKRKEKVEKHLKKGANDKEKES
ncbi:hypothetical protein DY000_02040403 [Brassica cretica]|uniref:Uncharacterized protein n=1 Tax=Brassica cretica TaxID=69181 RepID=A0ABQ7BAF7_BRACR|nr:hypothetical protein DY000_02040403 [Brassica cretica]